MYCSPSGDNDSISCLKIENLRSIANELTNFGLPLTPEYINKCNKQELFNKLSEYFQQHNQCKDELCWTTTDTVKKSAKNINDYFVPIMPDAWRQKPEEWLNTTDIDNVLKQYQKAYKKFHYTGAVPIDFDLKNDDGYCEVSDICRISIPQLYKKGIRKIGFVFNTDPSTKGGEHWIATFIDLNGVEKDKLLGGNKKTKKKSRQRNKIKLNQRFKNTSENKKKIYGMYFFDSTSDPPPNQIKNLYKRLQKQCKKININLDFYQNDIQHQVGNNECGVYCLYFISNMVKNRPFFNIIEDIKKDKDMHEFRKVFFRPK